LGVCVPHFLYFVGYIYRLSYLVIDLQSRLSSPSTTKLDSGILAGGVRINDCLPTRVIAATIYGFYRKIVCYCATAIAGGYSYRNLRSYTLLRTSQSVGECCVIVACVFVVLTLYVTPFWGVSVMLA
jgi:hypothetical protein